MKARIGGPSLLPLVFVGISGTGFVAARLGLSHAEPFTFLALRFGAAALMLALIAWLLRSPWPRNWRESFDIAVSGLLGIAVFSSAVFYSIALGVPPAVAALIIALHPMLVAVGAGRWLGEHVSPRQWLGLLLGLGGVFLVLEDRLVVDSAYAGAALLSVLGLLGLVTGNLYQKARCSGMDTLSGSAIQNIASASAMTAGAGLWESGTVNWSGEFILALFWMTIPVSVGAVTLLQVLIRRGEISRVASYFYLLPVSAAITAYAVFGQTVDTTALGGIALAAVGVTLAALPRTATDQHRALKVQESSGAIERP